MAGRKICESCHAPLTADWQQDEKGNYICPYCSTINDFTYADSPEDDPRNRAQREIEEIYPLLENLAFDTADRKLSDLRHKYPTNSKVWFLSVLSQYYVCYVKESEDKDAKYIPTLNNLNLEELPHSQFVAKALELAPTEMVRKQYQETFDYIETKRREIQEAFAKDENKYDIFISVKVGAVRNGQPIKDEAGNQVKSIDFSVAEDIYRTLRDAHYRVFFSESIDFKQKVAGNRYENVIYAALHSAKAFILVGESIENLESRWVRNEWLRYLWLKDHEKGDEVGDHNIALVTTRLNEGDLPRELQGNQFIRYGVSRFMDVLNAFLSRSLSKKKVQKLEAKTFDSEVAKIDLSSIESDGFVARSLATSQAAMTESEEDQLLTIAENLDPRYERARVEAFEDLHDMLKRNPDLYMAKKLLLLEGTKYFRFEDYIGQPAEIAENPKIAQDFLEFATEDDAKGFLNDIVNTMAVPSFYFGFDKDEVKSNKTSHNVWVNNLHLILDSLVTPYLDSIKKEALVSLTKKLKNNLGLIPGDTENERKLVKIFFGLCRYLDGKDPKPYVNVREDYLRTFDGGYLKDHPQAQAFCDEILAEILSVNPGAVDAPWSMIFLRHGLPILTPQQVVRKVENEGYSLPIIGNKNVIESFGNIIRYSSKEKRPFYLQAYLSLIVADPKAYQTEEDGSLLLSKKSEDGQVVNDADMNGFDLFNKYIAYPLPDKPYPSTVEAPFQDANVTKEGKMIQVEPLFVPNHEAYLKKQKPLPIDALICTFAVNMHKRRLYDEAHTLYQLYLGQQENPISMDAALIRFYDELAKVRVVDAESLHKTGRPLDHKGLEADLIKLRKVNPEAQKLYECVKDAYNYQYEYSETYRPIQEIVAQVPEAWHIDDIENLEKIRSQIEGAIDKVSPAVAADIRHEFRIILGRFERDLPKVKRAQRWIDHYFGRVEMGYVKAQLRKRLDERGGVVLKEKHVRIMEEIRDELVEAIVDYDVPANADAHKNAIETQSNQIIAEVKEALKREQDQIEASKKKKIRLENSHRRHQRTKAAMSAFGEGLADFFSGLIAVVVGILCVAFGLGVASYAIYPSEQTAYASLSCIGISFLLFFVMRFIKIGDGAFEKGTRSVFIYAREVAVLLASFILIIYCGYVFIADSLGSLSSTSVTMWHYIFLFLGLANPILSMIRWYRWDYGSFLSITGGISYVFIRFLLLVGPSIMLVEFFKGWNVDCFDSSYGFFVGWNSMPDFLKWYGIIGLIGTAIWSGIQAGVWPAQVFCVDTIHKVFGAIASIAFDVVGGLVLIFGVLALLGSIGMFACQSCNAGCVICESFLSCSGTGCDEACALCSSSGYNFLGALVFGLIGFGATTAAGFETAASFDIDV